MRNKLLGALLFIILIVCFLLLNDYMNDSENSKKEESTNAEATEDFIYHNNLIDNDI